MPNKWGQMVSNINVGQEEIFWGWNSKKIVHRNGKIVGAILQGDLAYGGILQQLIARKIDITKVKKFIFDVDYSDFFHIDENFEF